MYAYIHTYRKYKYLKFRYLQKKDWILYNLCLLSKYRKHTAVQSTEKLRPNSSAAIKATGKQGRGCALMINPLS